MRLETGISRRQSSESEININAALPLLTAHPISEDQAAAAGEEPKLRRKLVIPIVVGTRPEAIKLVPVILALRRKRKRARPLP